jgi:uncharacterized protein YbjT (DUF2867 family)
MTDSPVLVVGATGYLGRKIVDALLARGKTVRALVRLVLSLWPPTVPITFVLSSDVAGALAEAVDGPVRDGEHVDLGWDRPLTVSDVAELTGHPLGRRMRVLRVAPVVSTVTGLLGRIRPEIADVRAMFDFFGSGRYVADTRRQAELFGPVPTADAAIARWASPAD